MSVVAYAILAWLAFTVLCVLFAFSLARMGSEYDAESERLYNLLTEAEAKAETPIFLKKTVDRTELVS